MSIRALGIIAAASCAVSFAAPASARPELAAHLEQLVADLDADSFQTRQDAESQLNSDEINTEIQESDFAEFFSREKLAPEQRHRLRRVYHNWFAQRPRAGMGVGPQNAGNGVPVLMVRTTSEEFPCHKLDLLRRYDTIISIDHVPTIDMVTRGSKRYSPQGEFFRAAILSRDPGETMHLTIRRPTDTLIKDLLPKPAAPGANPPGLVMVPPSQTIQRILEDEGTVTIDVEIPLGSYADLNDTAAPLDHVLLSRAAAMRLARLGINARPPATILDVEMTPEDWKKHSYVPNRRRHNDVQSVQSIATPDPIHQGNKLMVARAIPDMRRPGGLEQARALALRGPINVNAPIVLRDMQNLTPEEKRLIEQQIVFKARVAALQEKITEQSRIAKDRSRPERERFLAEGLVREYRAQHTAARKAYGELQEAAKRSQRQAAEAEAKQDNDAP